MIRNPRLRILRTASPAGRPRSERSVVTPTMNRKNGKIRSVGVQPCHSAWPSGQKMALHVPGLLTSSIDAIVMPRNTSSATRRSRVEGAGDGATVTRAVYPERSEGSLVHRRATNFRQRRCTGDPSLRSRWTADQPLVCAEMLQRAGLVASLLENPGQVVVG